jgi:hypothetical protein
MGRYDLNKQSNEEKIPKQKEEPLEYGGSPLIEPIEVKLVFSVDDSMWKVKIKTDKNVWISACIKSPNGYTETVRFNTAKEAEQWCKTKGLI